MGDRDVINLATAIAKMGYSQEDYRVVHFGSHQAELKVTNKELHWLLKSMSKLVRQKDMDKGKRYDSK